MLYYWCFIICGDICWMWCGKAGRFRVYGYRCSRPFVTRASYILILNHFFVCICIIRLLPCCVSCIICSCVLKCIYKNIRIRRSRHQGLYTCIYSLHAVAIGLHVPSGEYINMLVLLCSMPLLYYVHVFHIHSIWLKIYIFLWGGRERERKRGYKNRYARYTKITSCICLENQHFLAIKDNEEM